MPVLRQSKAKPAIYHFTIVEPGPHTNTREWENYRFKEWGWVSFRELQEVTGRTGAEIMELYGHMYNGWWYARCRTRWNQPLLLALRGETPGQYDAYVWESGRKALTTVVERIAFVPAGWALQIIEDEKKPAV